jgi:hypothetical protein
MYGGQLIAAADWFQLLLPLLLLHPAAGGLRLLRYGSLHGSVLGLEVVLANGQVGLLG